jgi:2-polyprenyl-6-methoxyphenol hydroxylase-like FAD-dependent oxidoreductase
MKASQVYSPSNITVLIVGGGIGGLATALACQRNGIKAYVFERAQQFREVGSGMILSGNVVAFLQKLGLDDVIQSIAAPLHYGHLRSWRGDVLMDMPMQSTMQGCGTSAIAVHRAELMATLVQSLERERLHTNVHVTGFEQDEQGLRLQLASGEVVQGDLLVGADGLHSVVRSNSGTDESSNYTEKYQHKSGHSKGSNANCPV